jgi:hypothetical protein
VDVYKVAFCLSSLTFLHHHRVSVLSKMNVASTHVPSSFQKFGNTHHMFASCAVYQRSSAFWKNVQFDFMDLGHCCRKHKPQATCSSCRLAENPWARESIHARRYSQSGYSLLKLYHLDPQLSTSKSSRRSKPAANPTR